MVEEALAVGVEEAGQILAADVEGGDRGGDDGAGPGEGAQVLVLDSFAGSGTTGAVAHKMGRRWIMVELGEHCQTHIVPRLKKVIDGEDQGGISKAVNWQGGGSFRYFRLAPSLLKKDSWGNWIINKAYNAEMLSEAMCKHMGFQYAPSQAHFWMHGHSSETDFIYVTTGSLSHDQLKVISDEVGNNRTLLICCKAFMAETNAFSQLDLKKDSASHLAQVRVGSRRLQFQPECAAG